MAFLILNDFDIPPTCYDACNQYIVVTNPFHFTIEESRFQWLSLSRIESKILSLRRTTSQTSSSHFTLEICFPELWLVTRLIEALWWCAYSFGVSLKIRRKMELAWFCWKLSVLLEYQQSKIYRRKVDLTLNTCELHKL